MAGVDEIISAWDSGQRRELATALAAMEQKVALLRERLGQR